MNAFSLLLFVAAFVLALTSAMPTAEETAFRTYQPLFEANGNVEAEEPTLDVDEIEPDSVKGGRSRRATCDLLSVDTPFGSLNHSACAAHCLAMRKGFKGGHCKNGVCHCRK